jgi:CRP/FNR family cyclic AMP-dependent transcriptional regulator
VFSGLRNLYWAAARMVGPHGAGGARQFNSEREPAPWVQSRLFNTRRTKQRMDAAPLEPPDDILTALARRGDTRTWEPGMTVVSEGEMADCMYIIHSGELRAVVAGDGGRQVELNTLGPGEFFGELMLSGALRAATVEVTVRARLTRVPRAAVEQVLSARPDLALQMIHRLVQRVRTLTHTVGRLASVDVYGRLVGLFEALAVEDNGRRVVRGPMSQARIAERLGASRAMVNRLLQDLARGGYIELTGGHIVLLKKLPLRW